MDSKVYVNGQFVGHYPNGYNAFSYDITPYLNADGSENTIAVHVVNQQPSSVGILVAGFTGMLS